MLVNQSRVKRQRKRGRKKKTKQAPRNDIWKSLGKEIIGSLPEIIGSVASLFPVSGAHTTVTPFNGPIGQSMTTSAPIANGAMVRTTVPKVRNRVNGVRVTHREYISEIAPEPDTGGESVFAIAFMGKINPGNARVFPWLSTIAQRFESYIFKSLRFIYEMQSATTNSGTVMLVVDYDTVDPPPASKEQMMAYVGAVRSPPWFAAVFNAAPGDLRKAKTYYVNASEDNPSGTDPKTYFVGNVYCATQATIDEGVTWGELYVEYDVELITPVLDTEGATQALIGFTYNDDSSTTNVWRTGGLDILYDGTDSLLDNQEYYIPSAGVYTIELIGKSADASVVPNITITPLAGSTVAAEVLTDNAQTPPWVMNTAIAFFDAPNFYCRGQIYIQTPPGGFTLTNTMGTDTSVDVALLVTPVDPQIYKYLGVETMSSFGRMRARTEIRRIKSRTRNAARRDQMRLEDKSTLSRRIQPRVDTQDSTPNV